MKTFIQSIIACLLSLLFVLPVQAKHYIVGISPFIPDASRGAVFSDLLGFLLSDVSRGDDVALYDAYHLRKIGTFKVPDNNAYQSAKARAKLNAKDILAFKSFMDTQVDPANHSASEIQFPQFLSFIGSHGQQGKESTVIVIGSPHHIDVNEPSYSMVEGFLPSDGHLNESVHKTPYGTVEKDGLLPQSQVHFLVRDAAWSSDLHHELTHRFWSLYTIKLGGELMSFSDDASTIFDRALDAQVNVARRFKLDPKETKLEMVSVQRAVSQRAIEAVFEETPEAASPASPSENNYTGKVLVGIRWNCLQCDIDLYAQPYPSAQVLHYGLTRTAEGTYHKDFQSSPAPVNGLEYIVFKDEVDLRQLQIAINFFKGQSIEGPEVEVRIEFDGRVYAQNFQILANRGNRGKNHNKRTSDPFWAIIDPVDVVFGGQQ